jgi:hypothetical protein
VPVLCGPTCSRSEPSGSSTSSVAVTVPLSGTEERAVASNELRQA